MESAISKQNGATIVQAIGKLDSFSSKEFEEKLVGLIAQGSNKLVIDCAQLEYVSSAGLRVFYLASSHLEEKGGRMVFCGLNANVRRVFDIVEMSTEFRIVEAVSDALQALKDPL